VEFKALIDVGDVNLWPNASSLRNEGSMQGLNICYKLIKILLNHAIQIAYRLLRVMPIYISAFLLPVRHRIVA